MARFDREAPTAGENMTHAPSTSDWGGTLVEAARQMADGDLGALIVTDGGEIAGIITDRDIVVRAVAEGRAPGSTQVRDASTANPTTLTPDQTIDDAIRIMREQDIRRIPVVQEGRPVGILSIGDLAVERDTDSALADISAADPNN